MLRSTYVFISLLLSIGGYAQPLINAHAHNDYEHERPFFDAYENGFCSFEADVHLVDGQLLVAHDLEDVEPGHTLQALYLDPMREKIKVAGGRLYPDGPQIALLIDIKSDAETTYRTLHQVLRQYADIVTIFSESARVEGAVLVIISGNRPRQVMREQTVRFAAFDGRLEDLENTPGLSPDFMPLVSSNWATIGGSAGMPGHITPEGQLLLEKAVALAHQQGRRLRFWGTGDHPETWALLQKAGVDLLNADNLAELRRFLLTSQVDQ